MAVVDDDVDIRVAELDAKLHAEVQMIRVPVHEGIPIISRDS
jgi:hypothetical protein